MGASFVSDPVLLSETDSFAIQLSWDGGLTPAGTFKLQSSNALTYTAADIPADEWTDVADSSQAITDDGNHEWKVTDVYKWVKVVYTRTSGDGDLNGNIFYREEN